jgi:hypothetical protein
MSEMFGFAAGMLAAVVCLVLTLVILWLCGVPTS